MGEAGGDAAAAQPGRGALPAGSVARSALPRLALPPDRANDNAGRAGAPLLRVAFLAFRRSLQRSAHGGSAPGELLHALEGLRAGAGGDDPALRAECAGRQTVARAPRRPRCLRRADHRIDQVRRALADDGAFEAIPEPYANAERMSRTESLDDLLSYRLPSAVLPGGRVALVRLTHTELHAREQAGIGFERNALRVAVAKRRHMHARLGNAPRTLVEHQRDRRVDQLHRAGRAGGKVGRAMRIFAPVRPGISIGVQRAAQLLAGKAGAM